MKYKLILLIWLPFFEFCVSAQDVKININQSNISIEQAFKLIEKQTSYNIAFNRTRFDATKPIRVDLKDASIDIALTTILKRTGFGYKINGQHIVIVENQRSKKTITISGYIRDHNTTESLIGATVYNRLTMTGTSANQYGFYSLTLPEDEVNLVYSFVGYAPAYVDFYLQRDTVINIDLGGSVHLQEVLVTASRADRIQERTQMSVINLPVAQIKSLPAFLGETDVLKALQLMPGIQSGGEGRSGLYVRGGGPDQNLFLLDGVPVYNVSHLFGFFSAFNADAINSMEVLKGGFPARYGGRVSSVIDISLKEGNTQEFHGEGAIGIISSRLTFEGPIRKDKTSFIISGRRSYADLFISPILAIKKQETRLGYYFYDLTAKINHKFSEKDRIYLSAYLGDDAYHVKEKSKEEHEGGTYTVNDFKSNSGIKWGNAVTAFRWNHIFSQKLFSNTAITYGKYRFKSDKKFDQSYTWWLAEHPEEKYTEAWYYTSENLSEIRDWSAKLSFDYIPSPVHYIRFGANATYHTYTPEATAARSDSVYSAYHASKLPGMEYYAYVEDDITLTPKLKVNIGLHWSAFDIENRFYQALQPRVSARYLITERLSVKASYSRMAQYVHLLTNSNIGLQQDLWVPSTGLLRPQTSDQVALGLAHNFMEEYELSLEGYYKTMNNVPEYKEGTTFFDTSEPWDQKIWQGAGRSYGMEFFAQKKIGTFTGWIGYTLSWTDRQFDKLNEGRRFYYKYDRRHDLSIALMKRFGKKVEVSAAWVYGSGTWTTIPLGFYNLSDPIEIQKPIRGYYPEEINYIDYGERNSYQMSAYHRLDISISLIKKKKWGERRWVFGVYNAYSRRNPFYIDIKKHTATNEMSNKYLARQYTYIQYSLFPIIPSISYQFKF